jgi:hypothetical protein
MSQQKTQNRSTVKAQPKPKKAERKPRTPATMATPEKIKGIMVTAGLVATGLNEIATAGKAVTERKAIAMDKALCRLLKVVNAIEAKPDAAAKRAEREAKKAEMAKAREERKARRIADCTAAKLAKAQKKFDDALAEMNRYRAEKGLPLLDANGKEIAG